MTAPTPTAFEAVQILAELRENLIWLAKALRDGVFKV